MKLSEFLKEQLKDRGSQAKFARATKISDATVSKWARGQMDRAPNFENCIRIANWSNKTPFEVFEMAERPDYAETFNELFPDYEPKPAQAFGLQAMFPGVTDEELRLMQATERLLDRIGKHNAPIIENFVRALNDLLDALPKDQRRRDRRENGTQ